MKAAVGTMRPATGRGEALYRETLAAERAALALEVECAGLRVLLRRILGRPLTLDERATLQGGAVPETVDELIRSALHKQARRLSADDLTAQIRTTMSGALAPREV